MGLALRRHLPLDQPQLYQSLFFYKCFFSAECEKIWEGLYKQGADRIAIHSEETITAGGAFIADRSRYVIHDKAGKEIDRGKYVPPPLPLVVPGTVINIILVNSEFGYIWLLPYMIQVPL